MNDIKDLPAIPDSAGELARPLRAMREALQTMMGYRSDIDKAAVRWRDLIDRGIVDGARALAITGSGAPGPTGPAGPPGPPGSGTTPDLTAPPDASSLAIVAGFTNVIVSWAGIGYTQGHGHKQARIYAVKKDSADQTLPTFPGEAGLVATAPNALTLIALPSEMNTRWHVWVKFETNDGVLSVNPAGGTNGVSATTGQDVTQLLSVLRGQITHSHLYADLSQPIATLRRDLDESATRALSALIAAHREAMARTEALLNEARDRGTALTEVRRVVDSGDAQLAQRITTLTATVGTNQSLALAAVQDEAVARAAADIAEAGIRNTLAVQLRGSYSGTDLAAVSTGLLADEKAARTTADASQVSRLTSLEATVNNPTTGVNATATALDAVETIVNGGTSGNSALASRTSALEATVDSPTTGLPATRASLATTQSAFATLDGRASSAYTVRTVLSSGGRTLVGGFGLMGDSAAAPGTEIEFGVVASRFWVAAPSTTGGLTDVQPFVIQTGPVTLNGVTIPAGVYMDSAYINNISGLIARFGTAWIDDAKIANLSAAKITAGTLDAARIGVGTLTADKLSVTSLSAISANLGTVTAGTLSAGTTFAGSLSAATGTFSGSLSAAGGTFVGTVRIGSNPQVSGTTMTGAGAVLNPDGTAAFGRAAANISFDGTTLTLNNVVLKQPQLEQPVVTEPAPGPVALPGNFFAEADVLEPIDAVSAIEFRRDGSVWEVVLAEQTKIGDWYTPNGATVGDNYRIRFDLLQQTGLTGGESSNAAGAFAALSSTRYVQLVTSQNFAASRERTYTYTVQLTSSGAQVCAGTLLLRAVVEL